MIDQDIFLLKTSKYQYKVNKYIYYSNRLIAYFLNLYREISNNKKRNIYSHFRNISFIKLYEKRLLIINNRQHILIFFS
jgi:hypothetical protein